MHAYKDKELASEITVDNKVQIGDRVFVKISANEKLPATVDYFLTHCTAYEDFQNESSRNFDMIKVYRFAFVVKAFDLAYF